MSKPRLERPDLFKITKRLQTAGNLLLARANEAAQDSSYQPPTAVLIRTKNDAVGLERILKHIDRARQSYKGRIDVIVADTESTDNTISLAKAFGATIIPIQQINFSYPATLN